MSNPTDPVAFPNAVLKDPNPVSDLFDTPLFNRLLSLIEKQNVSMAEQKKTLDEHGKKFDLLIRDAVKDDQPYDEKKLEDESAWSPLYEIATAKMKEEAEEWKGLMDVSLVFIAIFLAVLTAFLVPAAQSLSPNSNDSGTLNNSSSPLQPLPPRSDQNVCALYYLALIMAIFNAVLCVLGRGWVGKLMTRPAGKTHLEWTIRHEERKALSYVWIKPLVTILYWSLLLSIGLFMTGLLYQLQNLATSFDKRALILEVILVLGLVLAAGIVTTIAATAIHAVWFENSPFEGSLSRVVIRRLRSLGDRWSLLKNLRVGTSRQSSMDPSKQILTYMQLIAEASDPKWLDRAIPSFSFIKWLIHGKPRMKHLLKAALSRLRATDTSVRVRETLDAHIRRFATYCRTSPGWVRERLIEWDLVALLIECCSFPANAPAATFFTSLQEDNKDLRSISELPVDECLAHWLCICDQFGPSGMRFDLFSRSALYCSQLSRQGLADDVTRILSHVDPLSVLRSLMRSKLSRFQFEFVALIVRGQEIECLRGISSFCNNIQNYESHSHNVIAVFGAVISGLRPEILLPDDIDLSPWIAFVSQKQEFPLWREANLTTVAYLEHCNISALSRPEDIRVFLHACTDPSFLAIGVVVSPQETRSRAQALLDQYQSFFDHLPDTRTTRAPPLPPSVPTIIGSHSPSSVHMEMTDLP